MARRTASSSLAPAPSGSALAPVMGDPGLPYIGYALHTMWNPIRHFRRRYDQYGPVSWGNFLGRPIVSVQGPEAAQVVLGNREKAFASGPAWDYFIGPFFERGIMLLDSDEHLRHRRIMQQAFTRERLAGYLEYIDQSARRGIDAWRPGRRTLLPLFRRLTLDMALDVFLALDLDRAGSHRVERAFEDAVRAGLALVRFPVPGLRWSRGLKARRYLVDFLTGHIPAKRDRGGDDLFAVLCGARSEDGERFSDTDVVNHMIFVLMAAHDTSTIALTTMAYYLARHPEWQERCRDRSLALGDGPVDSAALDALTELDLVLRESLRLCPPVPLLPRIAVRDTEVLGHHIPAGTFVGVTAFSNHRLPEHWPDPERFDPERFAVARRTEITHPYSWFPFGGGVHKCIGMHFANLQIKAVMHQMLRTHAWSVPEGYTWRLDMSTLPVPRDGLPVTLRPSPAAVR
ncbi:cytochrome P450 [Streptomyces clavuligerus]|uniref:Cytochrome P450 n=8 Tax=Streptomyces clavuligerus TaxID=1901 RepID=E2Q8A2_STRCL|nr:cytochrome P450 [Streptomyces clavuligerus]ANW21418.1 cytochrome P450 [Streptomyces clavuligerus]AXU16050.1 cytochrome P450 [Streptomyces clavuligerus]EFG05434.1 Cytochrome P450 [Streptomyces clavuligerus]MBY6306185.1 cytochrome P450 [Streptomyces clavuligerus]QCS08828.1 cytochrome P450 [Streptomyces clavuligerus]